MNPSSPLISIVMPAYNSAEFIAETLNSVCQQTYANWELLITNDCSTDNTADIISQFQQQEKRIKLFHNPANSGPAVARNTALKQIKGSFLTFLDSDDLWLPEKLELQLEFMLKNSYSFTNTSYRRFISLEQLGRRVEAKPIVNYSQYCKNTSIMTSTVMIDLRKTGKIKMKDVFYDDLALWLELMRKGHTVRGLQKDLARYRVRSGSISRNKLRSAYNVWDTIYRIEGNNLIRSSWYFFNYLSNMVIKFSKNLMNPE